MVFKDNGWKSWSNWLGSDNRKNVNWEKFTEARKFVHSLQLNDGSERRKFAHSDSLPRDIPKHLNSTYQDQGWISLADWLGCEGFLAFVETRYYARSLKLNTRTEWKAHCKSRAKPENIPSALWVVYIV